jgi:AsmA protein
VAVLAGGSYVLLRPGAIAEELAKQVKDSTGYELTAAAPPAFALWPEPAVILQEVRLAAENKAAGGAPVSAEKLTVTTSYGALFSGSLVPKELEVEGARLNLLIDEKGAASWPAKFSRLPMPLRITNGSVAFLDERSGSTLRVSDLDATLGTGENGEGIESHGGFVWRQQPVRYTLQLKSVARLMEDGSPVSMTANGPLVDFYFDGRAGFTKGLALAGQFSVNSENFRSLARWLGGDLQPGNGLGAFTLAGAIDSAGPRSKISRATLSIDQTTAKGSLELDVSGRVPVVTGTLKADAVDFDTYLGAPENHAGEWSANRLPLDSLKAITTDFDVTFDTATYGDLDLRDLTAHFSQKDGVFEAVVPVMTIGSGKGTANIQLDASDETPVLHLVFTAEDIDAQNFFHNLFGIGTLNGKATVSAALSGTGKSQAEMISALKGAAAITMADGSFERIDPGALLSQVSTRIVEGWQGDSSARFKNLGASFAIEDGIATVSTMSYTDGALSMTITGEADLLRRAVDFRAAPQYHGADGRAAAWPVAVAIRGPWKKPKIYPDIAGLPGNPAEGYQKLKTMGLPVLPAAAKN